MIQFDDIQHRITIGGKSIRLQPLSYKTLKVLNASYGQNVSANELERIVWEGAAVSPETLKQRVFVLRKSLAGAGISEISIRSVRGEGYRLIIEPAQQAAKFTRRMWWLWSAGLGVLLLIIVYSTLNFFQPKYAPVNNRMVLWTNLPVDEMPQELASLYEEWRSALSAKNAGGELQLIFSQREDTVSLSAQARKSRAALISFFEVIVQQGNPSVRLQIIEPFTATTLRSDILHSLSLKDRQSTMDEHLRGIVALLNSGELYLNAEQRKNAQAPIWRRLRHMANPS